MNNDRNEQNKPQPQTAENPTGESVENPFENNKSVDQDVQLAQEELEKEQQFKEAQTERD
jgi:hypothetical protein